MEAEAAEVVWEDCLKEFPGEQIVAFGAIEFFAERSNYRRVQEILRSALAAEPTRLPFDEQQNTTRQ